MATNKVAIFDFSFTSKCYLKRGTGCYIYRSRTATVNEISDIIAYRIRELYNNQRDQREMCCVFVGHIRITDYDTNILLHQDVNFIDYVSPPPLTITNTMKRAIS